MQSVDNTEVQFEEPEFQEDVLYFEDAILEGSQAKWKEYRGCRFKLNPGRRDEFLRKREKLIDENRAELKAHRVSLDELDRKALYKTMVENWEVPSRNGGKTGFSSSNFVKMLARADVKGFIESELNIVDQFKKHDEDAEKN